MTSLASRRSNENLRFPKNSVLMAAAFLVIGALTGCVSTPKNCTSNIDERPENFSLNIEYSGSCPMEVVSERKNNGCLRYSKNVVCVCRSEVGEKTLQWQATEKGTAVDRDYFLSFDPFIGDPAAKSRSTSGQTPPVVLADFARRGTTDGKRLVFKYTVVPKDEDCPLLDPKIIVGD